MVKFKFLSNIDHIALIADWAIWITDFIAMIYPRLCAGCGKNLLRGEDILCTICKYEMPRTYYEKNQQNLFFQKFYGRIQIDRAIAYLHFFKGGITQNILHNFKYRGQPEIGLKLGEWFGADLIEAGYSGAWDLVLPIPLHRSKEKRRGYNQSNYLAEGIGRAMGVPFSINTVKRVRKSETQTHKSREERWENVAGIFNVSESEIVKGKNILLVDDVVTTGATLESCGNSLKAAGVNSLSFATLAIAH